MVTCVSKYRDKHNNIIGYTLEDEKGDKRDIEAKELKQLMINRQIQVENLKLTIDNKLIDWDNKVTTIKNNISNTGNELISQYMNSESKKKVDYVQNKIKNSKVSKSIILALNLGINR
jgi:hypothetical protein